MARVPVAFRNCLISMFYDFQFDAPVSLLSASSLMLKEEEALAKADPAADADIVSNNSWCDCV